MEHQRYSPKKRSLSLEHVNVLERAQTRRTFDARLSRVKQHRHAPDHQPTVVHATDRSNIQKDRNLGKYCFDERLWPLLVRLNMKCGECFASDDLREAVYELRNQVDNVKPTKNEEWTRFLQNFGDTSFIKSEELLEALYMLQNAYKREVFSAKASEKGPGVADGYVSDSNNNYNDNGSYRQRHCETRSSVAEPLLTRSFTSEPMLSLVDLAEAVEHDKASDVIVRKDRSPTNSTAAVRRRPKRPEINVSTISLNEGEPSQPAKVSIEVNIEVAEDCNDGRKTSRCESRESETSYLDVSEDSAPLVSAKDCVTESLDLLDEASLSSVVPSQLLAEIFQPLLTLHASQPLSKAVREAQLLLLPYLARLQDLQEQSKGYDTLRVKLSVVQEEKKQLLGLLKQRRQMRQTALSIDDSAGRDGSTQSLYSNLSPLSSITTPSDRSEETLSMPRDDNPSPRSCSDSELPMTIHHDYSDARQRHGNQYESLLVTSRAVEEPCKVAVDSEKFEACLPDVPLADDRTFLDADTQTEEPPVVRLADAGVQMSPCFLSTDTQTVKSERASVSTMAGTGYRDCAASIGLQSCPAMVETGCDPLSCNNTRICEQGTQATSATTDAATATEERTCRDAETTAGCGFSRLRTTGTGCEARAYADFNCGDGDVNWVAPTIATTTDSSTSTVKVLRRDFSSHCFISPENVSVGVGSEGLSPAGARRNEDRPTRNVGVGCYNDGKSLLLSQPCAVDDRLCGCEKPVVVSVGVGTTSQNMCDRCSSIQLRTIGVGSDRIDDVVCDHCTNRKTRSVSCGDGRIDDLLCDVCELRGTLIAVGVGDGDVNTVVCDVCTLRATTKTVGCSTVAVCTASVGCGDRSVTDVLCDRCESRMPLVTRSVGGDTPTQDDAPKPRCQMVSVGLSTPIVSTVDACVETQDAAGQLADDCVLTRHGRTYSEDDECCSEVASIMVNRDKTICSQCGHVLDADSDSEERQLTDISKATTPVPRTMLAAASDPLSQRFSDTAIESEEEDEYDEQVDDQADCKRKNDVIESCNMLKGHFNGVKRLSQKQMIEYIGAVENLWFETARRKRVNTVMVKSYIDLFQSQIVELLDAIVNLADDNGNTALHYALTYKNFGVVSVLLDSNVCNVDLENRAGYTPVMLAAMSGFESKTDKYILQRLFRLADINKQSGETGQTPLMLAVSRGNLGVVEILMDAAAEVNICDDDGSTALMCACEHGSIQMVKALLSNPDVDATIEDNEGSTALAIAMDAKRRDLALLIYGSLNFDARGRMKLSPSKQSLLGLGSRRSPSPVIGRM